MTSMFPHLSPPPPRGCIFCLQLTIQAVVRVIFTDTLNWELPKIPSGDIALSANDLGTILSFCSSLILHLQCLILEGSRMF